MRWMIVDNENYFAEEREDYSIKKRSKGIRQHTNDIKEGNFVFIYNAINQQVEQIYVVTEEVYPTDNEDYPYCIGLSFLHKIHNPISFEEMKQFNPKSKFKKRPKDKNFVDDPYHRAIGKITPNIWNPMRNRLLFEDRILSELLRVFNE